MKLIIGNKSYSSWSLRPWLAMRHCGIPFEEVTLSFNDPGFTAKVREFSPVGKVPVLIDESTFVWDSLAIAETLAERFPDRGLWPDDPAARALARSLCAEVHSGMSPLRNFMPMNCSASLPGLGWNVAVQDDIDRVGAAWRDCRSRFGRGGPFLFGGFTHVDAFFAPIASRFVTYAPELPADVREYVSTIHELPAMATWIAAARAEHDFVVVDEPYRRS